MQHFTDLAHELADLSGDILRRYFRADFSVEAKADKSLVTEADTAVEEALRRAIMEAYPEHGIIGEEGDSHQPDAEYCWVLDPIDGTSSFTAGRPLFTTLIALLHHGEPIFGLIDQPITNERWAGDGKSATLNGKPIKVAATTALELATLATTSPDLFTLDGKIFFDSVKQLVRQTVYGGDAYNYALLASGQIDLVIEEGLKPHDVMALIPIITGAGGSITDWAGNPITSISTISSNIIALGSIQADELY